ncbi:hypothetical protein [Streptomyces sp. NPDC093149]|uniref:hypothetical protein n=1 Tax=Streptomyces sp. NPDC093149 TaxID=3366031 RepID=UPI00380CE55D
MYVDPGGWNGGQQAEPEDRPGAPDAYRHRGAGDLLGGDGQRSVFAAGRGEAMALMTGGSARGAGDSGYDLLGHHDP